jgi:hypothetical protein
MVPSENGLTVFFAEACRMLTDVALKLKPKAKNYKVTDRDGMYVLVRPSGTISFQLDYRTNGRRETVTFGKYGPADLSLARARELCIDAKRAIAEGRSPAIEKQREKRRLQQATSFGEFGARISHRPRPEYGFGRLARKRRQDWWGPRCGPSTPWCCRLTATLCRKYRFRCLCRNTEVSFGARPNP